MLQTEVSLEPISHRYHDRSGNEYVSMSHVLSFMGEKFDAATMSMRCAGRGKYKGMNQQQVLDAWELNKNNACEHGSNVHLALETYEKTLQVLPENEHMREGIVSILSEYSGYHKVLQEECLYNREFMIAGTCDKVLYLTKSKDSAVDLGDYKTNESIDFDNKYGKYLKGPLSHLPDCNFSKYSLQLGSYAFMLECLFGYKIGKLFIHHIPKDNPLLHKKIFVPYMRYEIIEMFRWYRIQNPYRSAKKVEVKAPPVLSLI